MVKKQRRKKLSTPSKTEGSTVQAEGEAVVGAGFHSHFGPSSRIRTPDLALAEQEKCVNSVSDCHHHCTQLSGEMDGHHPAPVHPTAPSSCSFLLVPALICTSDPILCAHIWYCNPY